MLSERQALEALNRIHSFISSSKDIHESVRNEHIAYLTELADDLWTCGMLEDAWVPGIPNYTFSLDEIGEKQ